MWNHKHDRYQLVTGYSSLDINPEIEIIRVKVRMDGYIFAYLIGDFNQWKKQECYRLDWTVDTNDGTLAMMQDISIPSNLDEGKHHYSFLLIDVNGNESLLSQQHDHFVSFEFQWHKKINQIAIATSSNTLPRGQKTDIVAIREIGYSQREVVTVTWHISPTDAALIKNGYIYIPKDSPYQELIITCFNTAENNAVSRTYKITDAVLNPVTQIHYYRRDNLFHNEKFIWNLWCYDEDGKNSQMVDFHDVTDFGAVANVTAENIIIRRRSFEHGWTNDWSEQTPSFQLNKSHKSYYVIDGDNNLYEHLSEVIVRTNPKIELALMDSIDKITAHLSDIPPIGTQFYICINQVKQQNITVIVKDSLKQVVFIDLPKSLRTNDLVTVHATNTFTPCKVLMRNILHEIYYNGSDLGCHFVKDKITLRIWAPTAKYVELLIYNNPNLANAKADFSFSMYHEPANGTHYIEIPASEFENKSYLYRLYFDELDQNNATIIKINYAVDPYAISTTTNGKKGYLVNINSTECMPNGWLHDKRPFLHRIEDSIIYEMHVRDFTINPDSGIDKKSQGKFIGLTQSGIIFDESHKQQVSTGLNHLVELGITHVHLLPVFDFSSVDEQIINDPLNRNWGYDPQHYNTPEGSYATDANSPTQRILELRSAIHSMHQHGIRVVMDMVYNHMADTANMDKIVPNYYFRTNHQAKLTNGSGCGNEFATEHPMVRKFVIESITHWINNYHIDGTRFDLMELMDFETTLEIVKTIKAIDETILVYGEPWKGGDSPLNNGTYRGRQKDNNFAIFNDVLRNAIRGSNDPGKGFVNNDQHNPMNLWNIIEGLKGSINTLTANPAESINYADAHDNYTLWDQIEKSQNNSITHGKYRQNLLHNPLDSILVKQNVMALAIILTAQGIPFFQGGAEFLRTKQGDHNSYKSDDEINQFYWQDKLVYKEYFNYIKGLIEIRNNHPAFKMPDKEMINNHLIITPAYNNDRSGVIVAHYKNHANNDIWQNIVIIYNASNIDNYDINPLLPNLNTGYKWAIVANNHHAGIKPLSIHAKNSLPTIHAHSICILHDTIEA